MDVKSKVKIRCMLPDEAARVSDLANKLQQHQKMHHIERLPTQEQFNKELVSESGKPFRFGTYTAVAVDTSREAESNKNFVVGYIIYSQIFSIYKGRQFWINSFFIEEKYRGLGLGKKFMIYVKAHCVSSGNDSLDVPFMNNNTVGQKFYGNYGAYLVNEQHIMMLKKFDD